MVGASAHFGRIQDEFHQKLALEQFPGYDPHIHRLWGTYDGIEDKSHDYFELQSKVSKLDRTAELGELALSRQ
jgi:hypothetical protein